MRKLIIVLAGALAYSQQAAIPGRDPRFRTVGAGALASRPATCSPNRDVYICNGAGCTTNGEYHYCTATDTWTVAAGSGAATSPGGTSGAIQFNNAGSFDGDTAIGYQNDTAAPKPAGPTVVVHGTTGAVTYGFRQMYIPYGSPSVYSGFSEISDEVTVTNALDTMSGLDYITVQPSCTGYAAGTAFALFLDTDGGAVNPGPYPLNAGYGYIGSGICGVTSVIYYGGAFAVPWQYRGPAFASVDSSIGLQAQNLYVPGNVVVGDPWTGGAELGIVTASQIMAQYGSIGSLYTRGFIRQGHTRVGGTARAINGDNIVAGNLWSTLDTGTESAPTISGCSATIHNSSTNSRGTITSGTTGTCTVTLTWSSSIYGVSGIVGPNTSCVGNSNNSTPTPVSVSSVSNTGFVISAATTSGDVLNYVCLMSYY